MKNLFRIWLLLFIVLWGTYVAAKFLIASLRGQDFAVLEECIPGVFHAFLMSLIPTTGVYPVFPRIRYLEGGNVEKPSFKVSGSSEINLLHDFDFNRLKTEIAGKWLVTFSDDAEQVLKFRTGMNFFKSMGTAAWLKYDRDAGKMYIRCFPMAGVRDDDDLARKMQKEMGNCINGINSNRTQDINLQQSGLVSACVSGGTEGGAS